MIKLKGVILVTDKKHGLKLFAVLCTLCLMASCSSADGASSTLASSGASAPQTSSANQSSQTQSQVQSQIQSQTQSEGEEPYPVYSGTRDPWLWPFSQDSIWNTPIGSDAVMEPAGFTMSAHYGFDRERFYITTEDDPQLEIVIFKSGRWSDDEGDIKRHSGSKTYFPKGVTIPVSTGNECTTILQPDGRTLVQLQPACYVNPLKNYINGYNRMNVDLYGKGTYGSHWGSGLSSIGGSIRLGELTSDEPIHHALKLNIWAVKWLYYNESTRSGYVWPADRHDSYATDEKGGYHGTNPNIQMGSLLALDGSLTVESLGIKTEVGKKLFYALQNYGAYITDDSAWDIFSWCLEDGVVEEVEKKCGIELRSSYGIEASRVQLNYSNDMKQLITNLSVVTNNSETSVGGGGRPRVPLAPEFK